MKLLQNCLALVPVTFSGATLSASHIVDIVWSAEGRFAQNAQIAAGKFVEVCGKLPVGEGVRWCFTGSASVDFSILHHVGKEVVLPARQAQLSSGSDTLSPTTAHDPCWMWTNKGSAPVRLAVGLAR